jgi:hypothetical protein
MRINLAIGSLLALVTLALATTASAAEVEAWPAIEQQYSETVQSLLKRFCLDCHSTEKREGELDLERFQRLSDLRQGASTWLKVAEMLDSREMPPKDAKPQPTANERQAIRSWIERFLGAQAVATAGDPGPVVLRRLNNAEYTYTIRNLTGVATLDPAREFPADGAAGEGFTNAGNALAMSPALLTKYLDAGKEVASHAVLLPDGFRFSSTATRQDWTNEILAEIRAFYGQFTAQSGGERVNLQGIVFDTNEGGRLPLEAYLAATLAEREALAGGKRSLEEVARERSLNAKYLGTLWTSLNSPEPSLLLDGVRARWRAAGPDDAAPLAAEIVAWQKGLWRFATVGHIGKVGGPKAWQEPVSPLAASQELRFKIPPLAAEQDVTLSLVVSDAGDGNEHDFLVWRQPRLIAPGLPDLLLRDVREVTRDLLASRERLFAGAAKYLTAADEASAAGTPVDPDELARKHELDAVGLRAWLAYLGIGAGPVELKSHFTEKITSAAGYEFIRGWGTHETPLLLANSSDQHVRVPGNMRPHSVAVHPSPTLRVGVGWQSPVAAAMSIEGQVAHAHPECGNGVTWSVELRRGTTRQRLAAGIAHGDKSAKFGPLQNVEVQPGDLVSLLVGPRDRNHACDLTAIELKLSTSGDQPQTWILADDISPDVLTGNPHPDRLGNERVWHFYTEADQGEANEDSVIPAGSVLSKWQSAKDAAQRQKLAEQLQALLVSGPPADERSPDAQLYRQLASLSGPLLSRRLAAKIEQKELTPSAGDPAADANSAAAAWGLDPAIFGKHPKGDSVDPASLCVPAPSVIEFKLPADLVQGRELVATGQLDPGSGAEGSVQIQVIAGQPPREPGLVPSEVKITAGGGQWTADNRRVSFAAPILVNEESSARKRIERALHDFRQLFPPALCYTKIVPVDEVVTLTLFYREDEHLVRLMLDEAQAARLNRLWDELHYVSQDALTLVDALVQLIEYATQDADPKVFEPLRQPFADRAAAFRQRLVDSEPRQLEALVAFAAQVYRRPLAAAESQELRAVYRRLRQQQLPHDEAFRLTLARVLVAPQFLYRLENAPPGEKPGPVSDFEVATRLSYFLWSSGPDKELHATAARGELKNPDVLAAQALRMLKDARVRRLATEFGCQWLQIYDFAALDEKSERHFPSFIQLRGDMQEESILLLTDLFQNDRSILSLLDADHTFLNEALAGHYGISGVTGAEWRRVEGVKQHGRGGILALSTTLAKQSGASRTSPVLRGNWVSEVLLGQRLPRPPKDVPRLPDDETATEGLTVRELVQRHASDERCASCHVRIDPLGFALESYDAIGRRREKDLAGRPLDTHAKLQDGTQFDGLDGLRSYLLSQRRDDFVRQFCRKLLGYALGRGIQLSDEPLLAEMQAHLKQHDYRFSAAVEKIVRSPQFREIRGRDAPPEESPP